MASKADIVRQIRESPLTDQDLLDIMSVTTSVMMGNALMGAGMDLLASAVGSGDEDNEQRTA